MFLSKRVTTSSLSRTIKISNQVMSMKRDGIPVIDLSMGEPDFATPENVKEAAKKAIDENFTKYTETDGIPALKDAISFRLKEDCNIEYKSDEIIVSAGGKSALFHLILALIDTGDEVIIPSPYWVSYPEMVNLAGGRVIIIKTEEYDGFKLNIDLLQERITSKTKAIILNNPSNPTGTLYDKRELERIASVILEKRIFLIADEIYSKLIYDNIKFTSSVSLDRKIKERTILINGVSKSYAMTGWRIGYAAGPKEIIASVMKVQSHSTSSPCSIAQVAAIAALTGSQAELQRMVNEFEARRNYLWSKISGINGISCRKPDGAFYIFPNVSSYFGKKKDGKEIHNSNDLAYYILKEANVAIVPGDSFGAPDHVRITFAASMDNLVEAVARLETALAELASD